MDAKTDANQEKWKPEEMPIMRTLRPLKALSSPRLISTKSGQCPLKKKLKPRWIHIKRMLCWQLSNIMLELATS
jgi:hypothetical protein